MFVHVEDEETIAEAVRRDLLDVIQEAGAELKKSREGALTLTKLEEALMWAQKIKEDR